jgi:hypothetical protein
MKAPGGDRPLKHTVQNDTVEYKDCFQRAIVRKGVQKNRAITLNFRINPFEGCYLLQVVPENGAEGC